MKQTVIINADKEAFVNDVCMTQVTSSKYVRLYSLDEDFRTHDGSVGVHRIICELLEILEDGAIIGYSLPNVIGISNSVFGIKTETPSLEGQILTLDNIDKCILEYYDNE